MWKNTQNNVDWSLGLESNTMITTSRRKSQYYKKGMCLTNAVYLDIQKEVYITTRL
jgi:hypothetical protein